MGLGMMRRHRGGYENRELVPARAPVMTLEESLARVAQLEGELATARANERIDENSPTLADLRASVDSHIAELRRSADERVDEYRAAADAAEAKVAALQAELDGRAPAVEAPSEPAPEADTSESAAKPARARRS